MDLIVRDGSFNLGHDRFASACRLMAILAVPGYIGWADRSFGFFILYAVVAGTALALADQWTDPIYRRDSGKALAQHALIRCVSILLVGGIAYGAARLAF